MALTATGEQVAWHDPGAAEEDKCCCEPGCCPYPAAQYGVSLFFEDLLEAINVEYDSGSPPGPEGVKIEGLAGFVDLDGYFFGEDSGDPQTGEWALVAIPLGDWAFYVRGVSSWELVITMPCLITGPESGIKSTDQIPDTLYASWTDHVSVPLYRVSPCLWVGESLTDPAEVHLYWSAETFRWAVGIVWPFAVSGYPNTPGTGGSSLEPIGSGGPGQSSPLGVYTNLGGWDYMPPETSGGVTISDTP